jgi:hypothetical protein
MRNEECLEHARTFCLRACREGDTDQRERDKERDIYIEREGEREK